MNCLYILIAIVVLIFIIWYISTLNKLNRTIIKIDEADSGIDIALTKRYDVLTKMVDIVNGYAKHEKETLFKVIKLRKGMTFDERNKENAKMSYNFEKINLVVENYPELKSNENYKILQQTIVEVEEHLQAARRMYNSNVAIFNQMLVTFPTNIITNYKGMEKKDFFELDEEKKQNLKIDL